MDARIEAMTDRLLAAGRLANKVEMDVLGALSWSRGEEIAKRLVAIVPLNLLYAGEISDIRCRS